MKSALSIFAALASICASAEYTLELRVIQPMTTYVNPANISVNYDIYANSVVARVYVATYATFHSNPIHYHVDVNAPSYVWGGEGMSIPLGASRSSPAVTKGLILFYTFGLPEDWFITSGTQAGVVAFPNNLPAHISAGTYWPGDSFSYRVFVFTHSGTFSDQWEFFEVDGGIAGTFGELPNIANYEGWLN